MASETLSARHVQAANVLRQHNRGETVDESTLKLRRRSEHPRVAAVNAVCVPASIPRAPTSAIARTNQPNP